MVDDKARKTNVDLRHENTFNDLQTTCQSPECKSEIEKLRAENCDLKDELLSLTMGTGDNSMEKEHKKLTNEFNALRLKYEDLAAEYKSFQVQQNESFVKTYSDVKIIKQESIGGDGDSSGDSKNVCEKTIAQKLMEKEVNRNLKSFANAKFYLVFLVAPRNVTEEP